MLGSETLKSKNACWHHYQKPRVLISTLASFELFDVLPWSSSPDNGVSLDLILVSLHTSDVIFAVRSRKSLCRMHKKPPFLQRMCAEYQIYYHKDKMLVDCMFSQPYQSLIESHNRCLDYSNPNSVFESNVNQFETTARVYVST